MTKLKIIKEHQPNIYQVEKQSVVDYINSLEGDTIHNYIVGPYLLGADWSKESVVEALCNRWLDGLTPLFDTNPEQVLTELVEILENLLKKL